MNKIAFRVVLVALAVLIMAPVLMAGGPPAHAAPDAVPDALRRSDSTFNEPPPADISKAAAALQIMVESPTWLRQSYRMRYSDDGRWSIILPKAGLKPENVILSHRMEGKGDTPVLHHVGVAGQGNYFFTADSRFLIGVGAKRVQVLALGRDGSVRKLSPYPLAQAISGAEAASDGADLFLYEGRGTAKRVARICRASDLGLACLSVDWPNFKDGGFGLVSAKTRLYLHCLGSPGAGINCRRRAAENQWDYRSLIAAEDSYVTRAIVDAIPSRWADDYPSHVFALSARTTNTISLVEIDLSTMHETVLHTLAGQNIARAIYWLDKDGVRPVVVVPTVAETAPVLLDPWLKQQVAGITADLSSPVVRMAVAGWSKRGRFISFRVVTADGMVTFLEFDLAAQTVGKSTYPTNGELDTCTPRMQMVRARDGLSLPVFVQRPTDAAGPLPTIVNVHGGPFLHDSGDVNLLTGFLCKAGFAVVSVNYRGSTGFGRQLHEAGIGVMTDRAPDDVIDAARWAVSSGLAKAGAVHLFGGSFGGYAVLNAASRTDKEFASVISVNGVTDMAVIIRRFAAKESAFGLWRRFFNGGRQAMPDNIPNLNLADRADQIRVPVYLIAGSIDSVVSALQSRNMAQALKRMGKPVSYTEMLALKHSFSAAQMLECARLILGFLRQNTP